MSAQAHTFQIFEKSSLWLSVVRALIHILSSNVLQFHHTYFVFDNYLGIIVPLIIIIVSLLGLLMKVKKLRSSASIMQNNTELRKAQQSMEGKINNRIGMVCGTFIVLQLPAYLVRIIVVTLCQKVR